MTLVVFSGDYDKALAAFVIANGGVAMGKKVTMFFTFWGLTVLRRGERIDARLLEGVLGAELVPGHLVGAA